MEKMRIKCPHCNGKNVIKKGKRKTKLGLAQVYYCKTCRTRFVRRRMKGKTYTAKVVIAAISYYNLGYTLEEASRLVNRRYNGKNVNKFYS